MVYKDRNLYNKISVQQQLISDSNDEFTKLPKFTTGCGIDCACHKRNNKIFREGDIL